MYLAGAGVLAAALVVGIVFAVSSGDDDDDENDDGPLIPEATVEPAGKGTGGSNQVQTTDPPPDTTATGDPPPETTATATKTATKTVTKTTTKTTTKTKTTTGGGSGTAACNEAISHALGKRCSQARSALARCSGPKKSTAQANVNANCRRGFRPIK